MPRQNRKQAYEDAKKQADAAGLCVAGPAPIPETCRELKGCCG